MNEITFAYEYRTVSIVSKIRVGKKKLPNKNGCCKIFSEAILKNFHASETAFRKQPPSQDMKFQKKKVYFDGDWLRIRIRT
jgi:hypothetical protein